MHPSCRHCGAASGVDLRDSDASVSRAAETCIYFPPSSFRKADGQYTGDGGRKWLRINEKLQYPHFPWERLQDTDNAIPACESQTGVNSSATGVNSKTRAFELTDAFPESLFVQTLLTFGIGIFAVGMPVY